MRKLDQIANCYALKKWENNVGMTWPVMWIYTFDDFRKCIPLYNIKHP